MATMSQPGNRLEPIRFCDANCDMINLGKTLQSHKGPPCSLGLTLIVGTEHRSEKRT